MIRLNGLAELLDCGRRIFRCLCLACCAALLASCDNYRERGETALRIGDFDRAVTNFSKALDASPADRDARYGLALAYFGNAEALEKIGQHSVPLWEKTEAEFRILKKVDDTRKADAMHSTCLFYLARALVAQDSGARVLGILDESIGLDSTNYYSYNLKALILESLGSDKEAQDIFVFILTKNPEFVSAYSNLGNLYWEQGRTGDAWDIWSMGQAKFPDNRHLAYWTKIAEDSLKAAALSEGAR